MKVDTIDYIWVIVSWCIIGFSFYRNHLSSGIIIVYFLMVIVFFIHIFKARRRMAGTERAYGEITGYQMKDNRLSLKDGNWMYPVVRYETEDGRVVNSVYSIASKEQIYSIGDSELICYDPADPLFFYFAEREGDLTASYYRYMIAGAVITIALFFLSRALFGG